ncbi:hypothetical protein GGI12_000128 [Dipsacomyces acuminosporus]|nr:hypothetical protein GGI12_000128 [Dipsacomyces acuminosporus]
MRPDPYKQKASRRYQAAHRTSAPAKKPGEEKGAKDSSSTSSNDGKPADESGESEKASTRQNWNKVHRPADNGRQFARRRLEDNSWRYEDLDATDDAAAADLDAENIEAQEEEDVREFLDYLKAKSESLSTDQSAVYFQLRSESESSGLLAHGSKTWDRLVELPLDSLLSDMALLPIHELLDIDPATEIPQNIASDASQVARQQAKHPAAPTPVAQVSHSVPQIASKLSDLAPNAKPNPKQQPSLNAAASAAFKPKFTPALSKTPSPMPASKPQIAPQSTAVSLPKASRSQGMQQKPADDLEAFLDDLI